MTPYGVAPLRGTFDGTNLPTITYKERGGSVAAAHKIKAVKVSFEDGGEDEEQTDGNGTVVGMIDKKPRDIVTLECIVQADTKANAQAAIKTPTPYTTIVLANFIANAFAFLNGTYAYTRGAKVELTEGEDGDAKLTIPMKLYYKPDGSAVTLTGGGGILTAIS